MYPIIIAAVGVTAAAITIYASRRSLRRWIGRHYVVLFGPKNVGKTTLKLWFALGHSPSQDQITGCPTSDTAQVRGESQILNSRILDTDGDPGQSHPDLRQHFADHTVKLLLYFIRLDTALNDDPSYALHHEDDARQLKALYEKNDQKRPWQHAMIIATHADKIAFKRTQEDTSTLIVLLKEKPWFEHIWHALGGSDAVPFVAGSLHDKRHTSELMKRIVKNL